jgi:hypothetical protein
MDDGWLLADGILSELDATGWTVTGAQWWLVAGGWWLLPGWLVLSGWWLVACGWWPVAGGWWLVAPMIDVCLHSWRVDGSCLS